jgi:hypothetical protein
MKSSQKEQAERKSLVGSDQATTYHKLGNLDTSLGGRFAAGGDVSGAEEATHYPRLPESSPWSHDPVPPEAALGFSVEDVEPCGTPAEIAASIGAGLRSSFSRGRSRGPRCSLRLRGRAQRGPSQFIAAEEVMVNLDRLLKPSKAKMVEAIEAETAADIAMLEEADMQNRALPLGQLSSLADREVERTRFLMELGEVREWVWASAVKRADYVKELLKARCLAKGGKWL